MAFTTRQWEASPWGRNERLPGPRPALLASKTSFPHSDRDPGRWLSRVNCLTMTERAGVFAAVAFSRELSSAVGRWPWQPWQLCFSPLAHARFLVFTWLPWL